ncbi:MAG: hypothetical protein EOP84_25155, partial [Verrucomicrobiaceae bacterium]
VQLMGGIVLHQGKIAEMRTGEGKRLDSTLPTYLNALTGDGVHIITVNDYLAKRDSDEMGRVHRALGLTVGCIQHDMSEADRVDAYNADITYGTNNEFGFDYLRDHLKFRKADLVQRPFHYAIIDEADSILIDEARTPLIISGPAEDTSDLYIKTDRLVATLTEDPHLEKDEKMKTVNLTEDGVNRMEEMLRDNGMIEPDTHLYDLVNMSVLHHVNQALRAQFMFRRDKDYLVKDDKLQTDELNNRLNDAIKSQALFENFLAYRKLKRDDINICKVSEFRYVCSDCRVFTKSGELHDKPLHCSYNPYTATWEDS